MIEYYLYLNDFYLDSLYDHSRYGDRPEFYREHEKTLWIVFQILKSKSHTLTITDKTKIIKKKCDNELEFKEWVRKVYPGFENQLENLVFTKYPHPGDKLSLD